MVGIHSTLGEEGALDPCVFSLQTINQFPVYSYSALDGNGDNKDLEGLHQMGWWLNQFNVLENLFHDFAGKLEWGNKDYDHNPLVEEDG